MDVITFSRLDEQMWTDGLIQQISGGEGTEQPPTAGESRGSWGESRTRASFHPNWNLMGTDMSLFSAACV